MTIAGRPSPPDPLGAWERGNDSTSHLDRAPLSATPKAARGGVGGGAALPLTGITILDLSQVAIGPYATYLLSSLGARVIKVESNRRPDTTRGPVQPVAAAQMQQYPASDPGERPWNRGAYFNQRNRGKLGITLDFGAEAGKELFKRLVTGSDALVENYRASVMERQGLGPAVLSAVNPRLIYLKLSSQGATGPQRDYGSLGSTLEQTAGLASITGYTDGVPLLTNETYPDPVAGILGVGALIAALRRVRQTGEGQFIDLSQREVTAGLLGEAMMDYALNGRVQGPAGNRHSSAAPHGVYPAKGPAPEAPGAGNWIAIAVETDAQWSALRQVMGDPAWAQDARFASVPGRYRHQDELDTALAAWTVGFEHRELMETLQAAGVPAGAVLDGTELLVDPHLTARGWWEYLTPPEVGESKAFISPPWRLSAAPYQGVTPAPVLGQHNDHVYREIAGLTEEEYTAYQEAGIISTEAVW